MRQEEIDDMNKVMLAFEFENELCDEVRDFYFKIEPSRDFRDKLDDLLCLLP